MQDLIPLHGSFLFHRLSQNPFQNRLRHLSSLRFFIVLAPYKAIPIFASYSTVYTCRPVNSELDPTHTILGARRRNKKFSDEAPPKKGEKSFANRKDRHGKRNFSAPVLLFI